MGEIKSTLDLVMEKTRHMTMSREERDAQKIGEIRKKLNGLIQKYNDGLLRRDQFRKEFEKLDRIESLSNKQMLQKEILDRVELEKETRSLLELLEFNCRVDITDLDKILREFATQRDAVRDERSRELKQALRKEIGVSGSAVVPNMETDAYLEEMLGGLEDDFRKRLDAEKARLLD